MKINVQRKESFSSHGWVNLFTEKEQIAQDFYVNQRKNLLPRVTLKSNLTFDSRETWSHGEKST